MKHFAILLILTVLTSCAKNASESAAESSLHQVAIIEQQIKKECPTAKFDDQMTALKESINQQLKTCETEKGVLKERNNTLIVILIGIIVILGVGKWAKLARG